ncbi:MAG: gfo/Idh/MocA family oxidoreductase, partial [Candidatus Hydrogenedentes bacterium]|nr:gfo/Idh/MocA family oxidoreductase [Candidatus Hydrogenedentota bacterium]
GVIEGSTAIWPGHPARIELHGTDGSVVMEDGKIKVWTFRKRKPIDKKVEADMNRESELGSGADDPLSSLKIEGHRRQIADFTRAIQKGTSPTIEGREGRRAVQLIESIYKSATSGRTVNL